MSCFFGFWVCVSLLVGVCLGFVRFCFVCGLVHLLHDWGDYFASLRVWRSVLKISLSVVFSVFSQWNCGHSSGMCFCVSVAFLHIPHSVFLVVVPVVVFHIQHSCSCFEDCAGLFPCQLIHVFRPFSWFPLFLFSIQYVLYFLLVLTSGY